MSDKEEGRADDSLEDTFPKITTFEQKPGDYFSDPKFYQKVLSGEGQAAQNLHKSFSAFTKETDPTKRNKLRVQTISLFWQVYRSIAGKLGDSFPLEKRLFLRYSILIPNIISQDQKSLLCRIIFDKTISEPIHYADEWLALVGQEVVNPLATDETDTPSLLKRKGPDAAVVLKREYERYCNDVSIDKELLKAQFDRQSSIEQSMLEDVKTLLERGREGDLGRPYSDFEKGSFDRLVKSVQDITTITRNTEPLYSKFMRNSRLMDEAKQAMQRAGEGLEGLYEESEEDEVVPVINEALIHQEVETIQILAKLCVGRKGNHFPFLMKSFFSPNIKEVVTRENLVVAMAHVESLDPELFHRQHRQQKNRIVPHTIIIPCFGERGCCWEPFERVNRSTSRGRIAVPLYPKSVYEAVIYALADLRWNVAKEKAGPYWMSEGITGFYYQWFVETGGRGDVRLSFLDDYFLWITKESAGMQKLDREVRGIFWRNIPFPQKLKDQLKDRGYYYKELHDNDRNRAKR